MPSWYRLLSAAKYLGVPPWELADQPVWWQEIAWAGMAAESSAQRQRKRGGKDGAPKP